MPVEHEPSSTSNMREFVVLMAAIMSLVALAIDSMLPALPQIGSSLGVQNNKDTQLIITMLFLGIGFGQILFGPLSDAFGRKPAIYCGISLFMVGCFISLFATDLQVMLTGDFSKVLVLHQPGL